jgi:hypothetical protein
MKGRIMAYDILIGNLGGRGHFEELGEVCKLIMKRINDKEIPPFEGKVSLPCARHENMRE